MDRLAVGSTNKVDLRSTHFKDLGCPQEGPAYTEAFLTVLRQVSKEEVVQYILALLDDMITGETFLQALACPQFRVGWSPGLMSWMLCCSGSCQSSFLP